jgi:hypothetical protein
MKFGTWAIYADDKLISSERAGIENTSGSESDKYEELIVKSDLTQASHTTWEY